MVGEEEVVTDVAASGEVMRCAILPRLDAGAEAEGIRGSVGGRRGPGEGKRESVIGFAV